MELVSLSGSPPPQAPQDMCQTITYASIEVIFPNDLLHSLWCRPNEGRGVQVVKLVEVEEGGEVCEHLVSYPVPGLLPLLYFVDDVVGNLAVLPHAEHIVPLDGGRVPHKKHTAFPFTHEEVCGILPGHGTEVPTAIMQSNLEIKNSAHNGYL